MKLSYYEWRKNENIINLKNIRIIFIEMKNAIILKFQQFFIQLKKTNWFFRFIINEYYIILIYKKFKKSIKKIKNIIKYIFIQLILLIMIFFIEIKKKLKIILNYKHWKIIRKINDKCEIKYKIKELKKEKNEKDINKIIKKLLFNKMKKFDEKNKMIVYYLQKKWVKKLNVFLNNKFENKIYKAYYANINKNKWSKIFKKWKNEDLLYLIIINAFEAKINHNKIKLIIHYKHI